MLGHGFKWKPLTLKTFHNCESPLGFVACWYPLPSVRPSPSSGRRWAMELNAFGVKTISRWPATHCRNIEVVFGPFLRNQTSNRAVSRGL